MVTLFLPPLRERREDVPLLVDHFLQKYNNENNRRLTISPQALEIMLNCNWPGNVRELENCVERSATMTRGNAMRDLDLPCQQGKCFSLVLQGYGKGGFNVSEKAKVIPISINNSPTNVAPQPSSRHAQPTSERERLIWAMEQCGWVQAKAARLLDLTPRQIGTRSRSTTSKSSGCNSPSARCSPLRGCLARHPPRRRHVEAAVLLCLPGRRIDLSCHASWHGLWVTGYVFLKRMSRKSWGKSDVE